MAVIQGDWCPYKRKETPNLSLWVHTEERACEDTSEQGAISKPRGEAPLETNPARPSLQSYEKPISVV